MGSAIVSQDIENQGKFLIDASLKFVLRVSPVGHSDLTPSLSALMELVIVLQITS